LLRAGAIAGSTLLVSELCAAEAPQASRQPLAHATLESTAHLPDRLPKARSAVVVFLEGGLSHLDSFDPKPQAASRIRGPFGTVRTPIPGLHFSELWEQTTRIADRLAVIRSMTHDQYVHERACDAFLPMVVTSLVSNANVDGDFARAAGLVESGQRLVVIRSGGWDLHIGLEDGMRRLVPPLDHGFAGLVRDLEQRGLLDSTLVLLASEFGRSPLINGDGGREHWPYVYSVVLAGGGLPGGAVIGASSADGSEPRDPSITPAQLSRLIASVIDSRHIDVA